MESTDNPAPPRKLYHDRFGDLDITADGRLIWQAADQWWDKDDEARWRKLAGINHPALARASPNVQAGRLTVEFQTPRGDPLSARLDSSGDHPALDTLGNLALLVQLADALQVLHSLDLFGLELSPATVFVQPDIAAPSFVLVPVLIPARANKLNAEDFLRADESDLHLAYIAQERLRARAMSPAVDVYALGVLGCQILSHQPLPTRPNRAEMIHAIVSKRFVDEIYLPDGAANDLIRECLARRPGRRPTAAEARAGFSAALREVLCQPCNRARQQRDAGDVNAALETLRAAIDDPIRGRNPGAHLLYAELIAQANPSDPLPVIAAGAAAAERVERLLDEQQMTDPVDRYFTAHFFATPLDTRLVAREIYSLLGKVYRQERLLDKAIKQYDRALQVADDDGRILLDYAITLRQANRQSEALRALERAEKVGAVADFHLLNLEKARAMEQQGMIDPAIAAYNTALRILPDAATYTALGRLELMKGPESRKRAEHAFRQAIELDKHQIEAVTYLADLELERNEEQAALETLGVVRLPADMRQVDVDVLDRYLGLLANLHRRMERQLEQSHDDPSIHRRLGDLYALRARLTDDSTDLTRYALASEDYLRALLSYDESLNLNNDQPEVVAKAQAIEKPLTQAESELEFHIQQGDTATSTYNRLALVKWRLATLVGGQNTRGAREASIGLLRRAVELLDLSMQQDLGQREVRRLFATLAEQLRAKESGE